eukprot:scaffold8195_cov156-Amphora_coffeaeformis.AAC.6
MRGNATEPKRTLTARQQSVRYKVPSGLSARILVAEQNARNHCASHDGEGVLKAEQRSQQPRQAIVLLVG